MIVIEHTGFLAGDYSTKILQMAGQVEQADGASPLNEAAQLAITSDWSRARHLLALDDEDRALVGYAQFDPRDASAQFFISPEHRGKGLGAQLLNQLIVRYSPATCWSFGTLEPARKLAERFGFEQTRQLLLMGRELNEVPDFQAPEGFTIDTYKNTDINRLVKVNAEAFKDHPEQGAMTETDFRSRFSEDWFKPESLLVARDASGQLVGFHWIKIEPESPEEAEVYVIGVAPEHEGKGLGRALLLSGLRHMISRGAKTAKLFVEAANDRVVTLYRNSGFDTLNVDTSYSAPEKPIFLSDDARTEGESVSDDPLNKDLPDNRYTDRELSWLEFNNRVLDLAKDAPRTPLLERVQFCGIFSSNLDEFFMVRVAGLKRRIDAGVAVKSAAGITPRDLYDAILRRTHELVSEQARVFNEELRPQLAEEGIHIIGWDDLTLEEQDEMQTVFTERIFPILTPLAVDQSHPFPYISGLSLNLGILLRNPETGSEQFARIKVPAIIDRFMQVTPGRFLPLEELISHHLSLVFGGMEIMHCVTFRVTRNEDVEMEEDDAENILTALEKELLRRKVGRPPVRLEVEDDIDEKMLDMLVRALDVSEKEVFKLPAPLDMTGLGDIHGIDREDLKYPGFLPKTHPDLAEIETSNPADIFTQIRKHDVLLHHPYDSFATSVERLIEQAASDPKVLAIKQTLYRTSGDSPIIDALIEAAKAGKQVLAVVEIKARFDEQANIAWARKLEKYGVHVVYGMVGLKTHCKLMLIVRDEGKHGLRRYAHIGTGNYNSKTARQYEDMGLLTCNPIITDDVARLFNHLSGMTQENHYRRLMVAPEGIRTGLIERINGETANALAGKPARIRIKVNSIVDEAITDALYRASQAGVKVQMWVRGICAVRPGVPGLSENIQIISVLGRYLEHSRIYWFENGGTPIVGIGSADLMHRNLDRRVEAIVGISNPRHIAQIDDMLNVAFDENTVQWRLHDQDYEVNIYKEDGTPKLHIQDYLIQQTTARTRRKK